MEEKRNHQSQTYVQSQNNDVILQNAVVGHITSSLLTVTYYTKKYILLNILGRKNIQVSNLDFIEECYKNNISEKKKKKKK